MVAILTGVRWHLIVVFICISLMTNDIELSIFSYVYGLSVCPLWRSLYSGSLSIFNWTVCLPGVELYGFLYIFWKLTLVRCIIGEYVLPHSGYPFCFVDDFFHYAEAVLVSCSPVYFSFIFLSIGDMSTKILLQEMSEILLAIFSSNIFMALQVTFKCFIHFEFILVYGVSWWSGFIFLHVAIQLSQHHLLNKQAIFTLFYATASSVKY